MKDLRSPKSADWVFAEKGGGGVETQTRRERLRAGRQTLEGHDHERGHQSWTGQDGASGGRAGPRGLADCFSSTCSCVRPYLCLFLTRGLRVHLPLLYHQ